MRARGSPRSGPSARSRCSGAGSPQPGATATRVGRSPTPRASRPRLEKRSGSPYRPLPFKTVTLQERARKISFEYYSEPFTARRDLCVRAFRCLNCFHVFLIIRQQTQSAFPRPGPWRTRCGAAGAAPGLRIRNPACVKLYYGRPLLVPNVGRLVVGRIEADLYCCF